MKLTLPDKSIRDLKNGSTGFDLANDIGPGLAKAAVAVSVDGVQKDLHDPIMHDANTVSYTHLTLPTTVFV